METLSAPSYRPPISLDRMYSTFGDGIQRIYMSFLYVAVSVRFSMTIATCSRNRGNGPQSRSLRQTAFRKLMIAKNLVLTSSDMTAMISKAKTDVRKPNCRGSARSPRFIARIRVHRLKRHHSKIGMTRSDRFKTTRIRKTQLLPCLAFRGFQMVGPGRCLMRLCSLLAT